MKILPGSLVGRWALLLAVAIPLFLIAGNVSVSLYEGIDSGKTVLEDILVRPAVAIPMWVGFALGISACVTSAISVFRKKDRSVLSVGTFLVSSVVVLFLILEIAIPH